ncbi:hypothetical protein L202_07501 [Cryptococcus amylolentus CBS 6039]|uniref:Ig-like domain-containing protein n=1 Tax=Cryptococcus amylolentus CBS 6039 TaxID=1295533 RepID=A0A1E3HCF5_9TREE|nr:hypothetical protein L202_07501 [Cryptococcus amylolentus CBS 6039]ODN74022.1 hypothetical protein L202_07501 [Cryptococcus amylolentus CBS 6039]
MPPRIGTPIRRTPPPPPPSLPSTLPPPPLIPTALLAPNEQRLFLVALVGLVEITKLWDTFLPLFVTDPDPTWTSSLRISGPVTVLAWTGFEVLALYFISLLRIPLLSPSFRQTTLLGAICLAINGLCWLIVEPSTMLGYVNVVGTAALGGEWYWNWFYAARKWSEPKHIEGVHKIRLLPYSTATLNPLQLTYCIPPDSHQPLHVPIVFNNSVPELLDIVIHPLSGGAPQTKTIYGSSLTRSPARAVKLRITDGTGDDDDEAEELEPEIDPLSALVLQSGKKIVGHPRDIDPASVPSVKPADSLALIPRNLAPTENVLFLKVDQPSVITLRNVVDKRGDRFHLTPRREAVIVSCPSGGRFVEQAKGGKLVLKKDKDQAPELRCVGDEDVVTFEATGVSPLQVKWEKKRTDSNGNTAVEKTGTVEGIEDTLFSDSADPTTRTRVSKSHHVPLRVSHDTPGQSTVQLLSVKDALHNTYTPSGYSAQKAWKVETKKSVKFNCQAPYQLLQNQSVSIPIEILAPDLNHPSQKLERPLKLTYTFTPTSGGEAQERVMEVKSKKEELVVTEAGSYALAAIEGDCVGGVMEPSRCEVQVVPLPTLDMSVTTLHECAMDVGSTAHLDFTGAPPFKLEYIEQRKGGRPRTISQQFSGHHGSIVLRPEQEGAYTYTFTALSDRRYRNIQVTQPPIKQTVHPLANAELTGKLIKPTLYSCSGDVVGVDVEARGIPPLKLTYLTSHGTHSSNTTITLSLGRTNLQIPVPDALSSSNPSASGKLHINLLSIEDGNGCVRKLESAKSVEVNVKREKPSARLASGGSKQVREGEIVKVPLRLTGERPWKVVYEVDGKQQKVTLNDPNAAIQLKSEGIHKLVKVNDATCPGEILDPSSTFTISYLPRPSLAILPSSALVPAKKSWNHQGLCAGQEDQVGLTFEGQAPFELTYRLGKDGKDLGTRYLKSAQDAGVLHLETDPGTYTYQFITLSDGNYPSNGLDQKISHQVFARPGGGWIKGGSSGPLCLDGKLESGAVLGLRGKGPWQVTLGVRKPASAKVDLYTINTAKPEWSLSLPDVLLNDIGRYEITLHDIVDSSSCPMELLDGGEDGTGFRDETRISVEVVESARIVEVDARKQVCVGDHLEFLLQGKAPWTIEYAWLGKEHRVTSGGSRFSRFAEKAGEFEVKSVALRGDQCKRQVEGMVRTVHPLPSARIKSGEDDLREGDEPAVFRVYFTGTAPFSFTYTRSEQSGSKWKVVETQTVTDIMEDSYAISSSLPGDYEVTSISDKYCRYPRLN